MSGFEIAGILLAVIPILYDALKDAPETSVGKKSGSFMKATKERRKFVQELFFLDTALRNAILDIFDSTNVPLTNDQLNILKNKTTMGFKFLQIWNDILKTIPDDGNTVLNEISPILESTEGILIAMVVHTQISYDEGREKLRSIMEAKKDDTLSVRRHFTDRFNFAKSSAERTTLLKDMKQNIKLLKLTVENQKKMANLTEKINTSRSRQPNARFLEQIRCYSHNLHDALSKTWNCTCHKSPSAMLRLEKRESLASGQPDDVRFALILTFEHSPEDDQDVDMWTFRETDICVK
jgi:hypothetical protein